MKKTLWIPVLFVIIFVLAAYTRAQPTSSQRCMVFVDARQGLSSTDWSLPGTTNFFDNKGDLVQAGSVTWNGTPNDEGSVFVTYPVSYGGGNTPIVLVEVVGPATVEVNVNPAPLFAGAYLYWETEDDSLISSVQFFWIAIGKDKNC